MSFGNRSAFLISIHHTEMVWPKMIFNVVVELSRSIRYWSSFCWSWNFNIIFLYFSDALLADLQNNVPGSNLQPVNGTNGTSGYGCLKGAKKKEPQVRSEMKLGIMLIFIKFVWENFHRLKNRLAHIQTIAHAVSMIHIFISFSREIFPPIFVIKRYVRRCSSAASHYVFFCTRYNHRRRWARGKLNFKIFSPHTSVDVDSLMFFSSSHWWREAEKREKPSRQKEM